MPLSLLQPLLVHIQARVQLWFWAIDTIASTVADSTSTELGLV